jgi:hypothetical protein
MVRAASLRFGRAYAFERHPDYVRRYGKRPREEADAFLQRILSATRYFADIMGGIKPANVGAAVYNPDPTLYMRDPSTGQDNAGDY